MAVVNTVWIENAKGAFAALYGAKKAEKVCAAVMPGVMRDFRGMLERAAAGSAVQETYHLDDGRGDVHLEGRREADGLYVTALTVGGKPVDLGEPALRI